MCCLSDWKSRTFEPRKDRLVLNDIETTFVNTFIARDLRERWCTRLASDKTRRKQLNRLAHTFVDDLDPRYIYDKDHLPMAMATQVQTVLARWKRAQPAQPCHIISLSTERDGQMMSLSEAETDFQLTFGAVIIIIADTLAYYHTERSNLSKQPFYVLFRQPSGERR
jgi:hypothetical protein